MSAAARQIPAASEAAAARHGQLGWWDERVPILRDLLDRGLSHEAIARALGTTTDSVRKKIARLARRDPEAWPLHSRAEWTAERLAALRRLFVDGLSHELIAQAIGLSKGAISGKLDRLAEHDPTTWSRTATIVWIRRDRATVASELRRRRKEAREAREAEARAVGVGLLDLGAHHCRWPLAFTDQWTFCGRKAGCGHTYCGEHERRSRVPGTRGGA